MGVYLVVALTGLLSYLPGGNLDPQSVEHVWELERNHVVRWSPNEVHQRWDLETGLRQWIVWERYGSERHVRCWRIEQAEDVVVRQRGRWRLYLVDGQDVTADVYHHSQTRTDVEVDDRKAWCRTERIKPLKGWQQ